MRHHQTTEAPNKPYPASSGSNQHSSHSARQQKTAARAHGTVAAATRRTRAGEAARTPLLGCWRLELLRFCPSRPRPRAAEARPPDDESTTTAALLLLGCSHAPSLQRFNAPAPAHRSPLHRLLPTATLSPPQGSSVWFTSMSAQLLKARFHGCWRIPGFFSSSAVQHRVT
jgi:hypothetical protein